MRLTVVAFVAAALAWSGCGATDVSRRAAQKSCGLGEIVTERPLLRPRPRTFYSVDVLNPDVVKWRGKYLMYFSGNSVHTAAGRWRTGLAISRSPTGPFRVVRGFSMPYLNGGTIAWRGRLWQATERSDQPPVSELLTSRDGVHWDKVADVPMRTGPYQLTADPSLQVVDRHLRLWVIGRRSTTGLASDIAYLAYADGKWSRPRTVLRTGGSRWSAVDIGEPHAVQQGARTTLLYVGTAPKPFERSIGLAYHTPDGGWKRCDRPIIFPGDAEWGRAISIDPSTLVEGRRVYVYYGAGRTTSIASDTAGAVGVRVYRLP